MMKYLVSGAAAFALMTGAALAQDMSSATKSNAQATVQENGPGNSASESHTSESTGSTVNSVTRTNATGDNFNSTVTKQTDTQHVTPGGDLTTSSRKTTTTTTTTSQP